MAVDPKQVLQRNVPLVVCYVLAIVPVILWVVLVLEGVQGGPKDSYRSTAAQLKAKKTALEAIEKSIKSDPATVYTPDHLEKYKKRNAELDAQYKAMIALIGERDAPLEKWLPAIGELPKDKVPSAAEFQTKLNTALDALKTTYSDIATDSTPAHIFLVALEPVADGTQRKIQKQFWLADRVLNSLKKAGTPTPADPTPIRLLSNIEFGQPVMPAPSQPGAGGVVVPTKILLVPLPIKITVQASFRDLPKICRELLAQDIVFRLKSVHTELLPFGFANPKLQLIVNADPRPLYEQTIYNCTPQNPGDAQVDWETVFPEPKIKITIELEAIDFDMDAIAPTPAPAK